MSPVERFEKLAQVQGPVTESEVASVFDELPPVTPEQMIGSWKGGSFDTGHPTHQILNTVKWAGKDFRDVDDVDPIMIWNDRDERVWLADYGHARLREVKYRGKVSAAMVYDKFPIIDSFRRVSDNQVIGAMDNKDEKDHGVYFLLFDEIAAVGNESVVAYRRRRMSQIPFLVALRDVHIMPKTCMNCFSD